MTPKTTPKFITLLLFLILCLGARLQAQFITTWITTDNTITIPTAAGNGIGYNYSITWTNLTSAGVGNGTISGRGGDYTITGLTNGNTYSVSITGLFPAFYIGNSPTIDSPKLRTIVQWGANTWLTMAYAFTGCTNLTTVPTNSPIMNPNSSMLGMFAGCTSFNQNIGNWNMTNVANIASMFLGCTSFNQNIGNWNTSNVIYMSGIFFGASSFNQNISG